MDARLRAIIRHWCLEQPRMAHAVLSERDVYELDVPRWLRLLDRSGLHVQRHGSTDLWGLFHQYVIRRAGSGHTTRE